MTPRPLLVLGATLVLGALTSAPAAQAQPAPTAPSPTAPVPLPPPGSTAPTLPPPPPSSGWGLPQTPPPYPTTTPGYGPGAQPPASPPAAPNGPAPNTPSPNNAPPGGAAPPPYPTNAYQPGSLWLSPNNEPMLMGADGALHQMPLEMKYDKDKGIPPGYRLFEKPRVKLAIVGGSILLGLWIASAVAGVVMQEDADRANALYNENLQYGYVDPNFKERQAWPMFLPIVGPFITIGTDHTDGGGTAILIVDGLAQAGMGAMTLAGILTTEKILKFQLGPNPVEVQPMATPTASGGFAGLRGTF